MLLGSTNPAAKSAKKTESTKPTPLRTALRFAFNPEIGVGLRPAQESVHIFVQLLASLFIAQGMFSQNHPAYLGLGGARLTLGLLLSEVWRNLALTKDNGRKILFFFVVLASLGFGAICFFMIMVSLVGAVFVGKAHAQGYFTAPYPDSDIAQQWLSFLFGSNSGWAGIISFDPLAGASSIQQALVGPGGMLGFYSDAILIVAAVILFYHLAAMTVETAHHGVVMGKEANQIWAPIRLVVAIGLLVPIGGGMNSGQYIVVKMAEWGSGLASNVWNVFLNDFASNSLGVASAPQYARDVVYNTFLTQVCLAAYNLQDHGGTDSTSQVAPGSDNAAAPTASGSTTLPSTRLEPQKASVENSQKCGHYAFNAADTGTSPTSIQVQALAQSCFDQMMNGDVQPYAQQVAGYFTDDRKGGHKSQQLQPYDGSLDGFVSNYMSCLDTLEPPNLAGIFAQSQTMGWLSAGAAFSAIAQSQSDANNVSALIPETQAPDFDGKGGDPAMQEAADAVKKAADYVKMMPQGGGNSSSGSAGGGGSCQAQRAQLMSVANDMSKMGKAQDHFLDRVLELIDFIAGWNCVWNSYSPTNGNFVVGIQFTGANPLAQMAALGQAMINTAYDTFDMMVTLSATDGKAAAENAAKAQSAPSTNGIGTSALAALGPQGYTGALSAIGGLLGMITTMFFTSGILLAYYVPLIPFIQFLFNILTWVICVLEGVIAVPMVALAHLNVKGDGLPGPSAKTGYFFIFNILLRPVMMIFGLVVGLLVYYAAVSYMNLFYAFAINTSGGLADAHLLLSRLIYSALYVIILYLCANSCFKCINWLPEHALRWLGQQPLHFHQMGDAQQVVSPLMSGAGNIGQVNSAIQSGGYGAAQMLGGGTGLPTGANLKSVVAGIQTQQGPHHQETPRPGTSPQGTPPQVTPTPGPTPTKSPVAGVNKEP